jgi:hypothetical protein
MSREGRKQGGAGKDPRAGTPSPRGADDGRERDAFPEGPGEPSKRGDPPIETPAGAPRSRHGGGDDRPR